MAKLNAQKFLISVKKLLPNVKTTVMEEDIVKMVSVNVLKDFQAIVANKKLFDNYINIIKYLQILLLSV